MVPHRWKVTHPSCSDCPLIDSWKSQVSSRLIRAKCSTLLGWHTERALPRSLPTPRPPVVSQEPMSPLPQTALRILPKHLGLGFSWMLVVVVVEGVGLGGGGVQTSQSVSGPLMAFLPGEGLRNRDSCLLGTCRYWCLRPHTARMQGHRTLGAHKPRPRLEWRPTARQGPEKSDSMPEATLCTISVLVSSLLPCVNSVALLKEGTVVRRASKCRSQAWNLWSWGAQQPVETDGLCSLP